MILAASIDFIAGVATGGVLGIASCLASMYVGKRYKP